MDPTLIGLLFAFIVFAAVSYHLGFRLPDIGWTWKAQTAFLVTVVMLIPFVVFVLYRQTGAVERLEAHAVTPLPEIRHAVGITTGQGPAPVWVFAGDVSSREALSYYDDPDTRPGWELSERGVTMIVLRRGEARLSVSATSAGRIIYMLRP